MPPPKKPSLTRNLGVPGPLQPLCPIGRRCHCNGKGVTQFGTRFTSSLVRDLAASSVLIGGPNVFQNDALTLVGSGTLVADNVVLCAAHSIQTFADKDILIFMFFECDAATAPTGSQDQYNPASDFLKCTPVRSTAKPIAKGAKVLEKGDGIGEEFDLDYALLAIEWTDFTPGDDVAGQKVVQVPRFPVVAQASRTFSSEVLLIAHPSEQPTQASAGTLVQQFGPHPQTKQGTDYGYATFFATFGSSGGGVFNDAGQLIGVLNGRRFDLQGNAFLNLSRVADHRPNGRIAGFLDQGMRPIRPGDPKEIVKFKVTP